MVHTGSASKSARRSAVLIDRLHPRHHVADREVGNCGAGHPCDR